jgi:hypothetical protein
MEKSAPEGLRPARGRANLLSFKAQGFWENSLKKELTAADGFGRMTALFREWNYVCCN